MNPAEIRHSIINLLITSGGSVPSIRDAEVMVAIASVIEAYIGKGAPAETPTQIRERLKTEGAALIDAAFGHFGVPNAINSGLVR